MIQLFYILKEIIFGQFATMYKAEDQETHSIVAVKKVKLLYNMHGSTSIYSWELINFFHYLACFLLLFKLDERAFVLFGHVISHLADQLQNFNEFDYLYPRGSIKQIVLHILHPIQRW